MLLRDVKLRALQRRTVQPFLSGAAVLLKFQKRKVVLDWTHCRATRPRRCGFHWNGVTLQHALESWITPRLGSRLVLAVIERREQCRIPRLPFAGAPSDTRGREAVGDVAR